MTEEGEDNASSVPPAGGTDDSSANPPIQGRSASPVPWISGQEPVWSLDDLKKLPSQMGIDPTTVLVEWFAEGVSGPSGYGATSNRTPSHIYRQKMLPFVRVYGKDTAGDLGWVGRVGKDFWNATMAALEELIETQYFSQGIEEGQYTDTSALGKDLPMLAGSWIQKAARTVALGSSVRSLDLDGDQHQIKVNNELWACDGNRNYHAIVQVKRDSADWTWPQGIRPSDTATSRAVVPRSNAGVGDS